MSSLQKFHRRTQSVGAKQYPTVPIGTGNSTIGFCLGAAGDTLNPATGYTDTFKKYNLYWAPKTTESASYNYGSYGTQRTDESGRDGLADTNKLVSFGQAAHPAAYYCKNLTTGGYNTWYMPSVIELKSIVTTRLNASFVAADAFTGSDFLSSTDSSDGRVVLVNITNQAITNFNKNSAGRVRAVRREV
jgi:hypothetical protein